MNEITIKVSGKAIKLKFGSWVMMQLIEHDYPLETLGEEIKKNPFKFMPKLIYFAACNAKSRDLTDYDEGLFFDYLDEVGINSTDIEKISTVFAASITANLGQSKASDTIDVKEKVTKKVSFDEDFTSFAVGELGLRLEEFYDMSWREFLLKSFAYHRMQKEKWQHTRFIAFRSTLAPHLDPKFIPKSIEQFLPLGDEQKASISDELRAEFLEQTRIYYENKKKEMAFSAQITADISNFESNLSKAGKSVDDFSKKVGDQLNKVGDSFIKAGKTASVFSGVVAGVAAGIGALAISTANYTKDLDSLSTITGITTDMLQEYQLIALKATVPTDAIAQATMALTRRLKDVSEEGAGAAETLRNLGVSLKDANGKMKTAGQVSEDAIMALAGLEKGVETNALGVSIFGRQWNDVIQIVDLGADEIAKLKGEAHDLGLVLSKDAITGSANFGIEVDVLKLRLKALKDQIGTELAPMLTNTLMPIIEEKIVPAFEKATKKIKFLVEQFDDLSPKTKNLIIAITGLTVAIGPVVLALGGIIKLLPLITTGFAALFSPVTAIITAVGLLSYGLYKIIKPLVETEIGVKAVKDATKDLHRELAIEQREIDKLFIAYKNANPATEEHRKIKAEIIANYGQYLKGQIDERGNIIDIDGAYTQLNSSLRDHIALKIKSKLEAIDIKNINAQAEAISKLTAKVADADKMKFGARLNEELRSFSNSAEKDIGKLMDTLASVTRDEFGVGLFDTSGLFDKNAYDAIRNLVNVMRDAESQTQALNIAFAGVEGASVFDKVATSVDGVSNSLDTLSKKDIIPAGSLKELTKKLEDLYTQLDEATTQSGRLKIAKLISDVEGKVARIKVKVDLEIQGKGSLEPITEKDIINIDRDSLIEKARQTLGALKPIIIEAKAETASLLLDWGSVIGSGLTGIMQGLGEALASGGNVMGNIGKTIIKTLGGLAQQVGSMMIAFGVAALNLYTLMANPVGAIIAGAALVALGSLAVAAVSGAMNKGLSGGGSSGTDAGAGARINPAANFPRGEFQLAGAYSEEVEFRISGDSLVGILSKKENKANRLN